MVPSLGLGTWRMGESRRRRSTEAAALKEAIDLGMTVIDTAEMYADGSAESLVGEAIEGRREEVFLVSKVLPSHARRRATLAACEKSLGRLRTGHLDLYLLHWRERTPLRETVDAFTELAESDGIRQWGVSNFDIVDMEELERTPGGAAVASNQVLYNLRRRGIEHDLLPWCRERGIPIMAYSPIEQGELLEHPVVRRIATRHDATPAQVALTWIAAQPAVVSPIASATTPEQVRDIAASMHLQLSDDEIRELSQAGRARVGSTD